MSTPANTQILILVSSRFLMPCRPVTGRLIDSFEGDLDVFEWRLPLPLSTVDRGNRAMRSLPR
jgi:hypothetical protein